MHEELLDFPVLSSEHTGVNLSRIIQKTLDKYNLSYKIAAITTDNASNNTTMYKALSQAIKNLETEALFQLLEPYTNQDKEFANIDKVVPNAKEQVLDKENMSNNDEEECKEILDKDGDSIGTIVDRSPIIGYIPYLAYVF